MKAMIHPLHTSQITNAHVQPKQKQGAKTQFSEILSAYTELKVSKHAKERMIERNINIDHETWDQITHKVFEAKTKGVTDALVLIDNASLIVSTKNNTVVTALSTTDARNKIFTNINGTIVI